MQSGVGFDLVAHFRIVRELGRGGMGVVYEARDEKLGRTVALKVLPESVAADPSRSARFLREARAAAQIGHACIATVFEIGEHEGHFYIAMEYVEGATLRARLASGVFSPEEALRIASDVASALAKAHGLGIVHRDLKPENVMLSSEGNVKLLDFGIAKALGDGGSEGGAWNTREGAILGTPGYMSPEQASGKTCDQRADLFAFGVLLYEMLTGRTPFAGETPVALLASVLRDEPAPLPPSLELPDEVRALVGRCLEKEPEKRPADAAEVSRVFESLGPKTRSVVRIVAAEVDPLARTMATPGEQSLAAQPAGSVTARTAMEASVSRATEASPRTSRLTVGIGAGVGIAAVAAGAVFLRRSAPPEPPPSATSSPASPSASPMRETETGPAQAALPPLFTCEDGTDGGFGFNCSESAAAWCDPTGKQVACCAKGLVPLDLEGACGCPPGGRVGPVPESCPEATGAKGLQAGEIQKLVRARYPDLRRCYERSLADAASLAGEVRFALRISFDGRVYSVRIQESSLPSGDAQKCLLDVWRSMRFPAPHGAGGLTVVYPVKFSPG